MNYCFIAKFTSITRIEMIYDTQLIIRLLQLVINSNFVCNF